MASLRTIVMTLGILSDFFPFWEQTDMTERVWDMALSDVSDAALEQATGLYIRTFTSEFSKQQPAPGDLRKLIERRDENGYTWQTAWNEISSKAHAIKSPPLIAGEYRQPQLSYPQSYQILRMMGGPDFFLNLKTSDVNTAKAQFRTAWQELTQSAPLRPVDLFQDTAQIFIPAPRPEIPAELKAKAAAEGEYLARKFENTSQALDAAANILARRKKIPGIDKQNQTEA